VAADIGAGEHRGRLVREQTGPAVFIDTSGLALSE
jgi:hypothetical protein